MALRFCAAAESTGPQLIGSGGGMGSFHRVLARWRPGAERSRCIRVFSACQGTRESGPLLVCSRLHSKVRNACVKFPQLIDK